VTAYFAAINDWKARVALQRLIPRARQLCKKYEINDPWAWILKVTELSPNERALILSCLRELEFRVREPQTEMRRSGLLRRILNYWM